MRKIRGKVTFAVAVLVNAIGKIFIADVANVLAFHTDVLAFDLLTALVAPDISVLAVTVGHSLKAIGAEVI